MTLFFLSAMKSMVWHALDALSEPTQKEGEYKRSKLLVFTHSLASNEAIPHLKEEFESQIPESQEKVTTEEYLRLIDTVTEKIKSSDVKLIKAYTQAVSNVCWELYYRVRIAAGPGLPDLLTENSAKVWWRFFNTFAEREGDSISHLFPVRIDWEEIDFWVNVTLKTMALPTNFIRKEEKDLMESTTLSFMEAIKRFNLKLNDHDGIFVYETDSGTKIDRKYIEEAMLGIEERVFEGIYINGYMGKAKKGGSISHKWCTLTKVGLFWGEADTKHVHLDPKNSTAITNETKIEHSTDKQGRCIRITLTTKDKEVIHLETCNAAVRNKWFTALLCVRDKKIPEYERDFTNRRRGRRKTREQAAELKEKIKNQRQQTKEQLEDLRKKLDEEKTRFTQEQETLRAESAEQLRERVIDYEAKMQRMYKSMEELEERNQKTVDELQTSHHNALKEQESKHEEEIKKIRKEMEDMASRHADELAQAKSELEALEKSKEDNETQLKNQLSNTREEFQNSKLAFENEIEALKKRIEEGLEREVKLQKRIEELEEELAKLRENTKTLQTENEKNTEDHKKEVTELLKENKRTKDAMDSLQKRLDETNKKIHSIENPDTNYYHHRGEGFKTQYKNLLDDHKKPET